MPKYVAFLRAINVGGRNISMAALKAEFEALGFGAVETFIASGNVAFTAGGKSAAALERKIETRLAASLGYEVATFLRTPEEVAAVAAARPFPATEMNSAENTVFVAFLGEAPSPAAAKKLDGFSTPGDAFRVLGREAYWLRRGRMSDSKFSGAALEKALGMPATLRNSTTVRKIAAKV